jgi:tetratricopeptide (TPR) repeat protein
MLISPETISLPIDWTTLSGAAGFAVAASVFASIFSHHSDYGEEGQIDLDAVTTRIAELEKIGNRTLEQNDELSELYSNWAKALYDEDAELNEITDLFGKAEEVLQKTLALGDDTEIRRRLGGVYLDRAVARNDYDEIEAALEDYNLAFDTLKPLDDAGDGEAKYDIAGVRLNRGIIYHESGEYEQAKEELGESLLAFRAVEKIGVFDTRLYMAKVSVQQGNLLRDMEEPLDKIVDAYNRAMRLFVEVIEDGQQLELERDLANVLLDRCTAIYEDINGKEFDTDLERINKIGDVLIDIGRGIEILERQTESGNTEAHYNLFNAFALQGMVLLDIEKYAEAKQSFDHIVSEFADLAEEDDPSLLNHFAGAYENRGFCAMNLGDLKASMDDFNEAIKLREHLLSADFGLDEELRSIFLPTLATTYANRANAHASLENKEQAVKDCEYGLELIRSLKEEHGDELQEIEELFENLLAQWK